MGKEEVLLSVWESDDGLVFWGYVCVGKVTEWFIDATRLTVRHHIKYEYFNLPKLID